MVRQESHTTMKENKIVSIIKQLTGQNDPEQSADLNNWEQESSDNQSAADAIRQTWEWSGQYDKKIEPDVAAGLSKLQARIAADRKANTPKAPKAVEAKRISMLPRIILRLAVAAAVVFSIGFLARNVLKPSSKPFIVSTTVGQQDKVELTDGSIVWLNENSSLTFGNPNNRSERRAILKGEAFFEVAKNPAKPFIIETEDTKVQVIGTSFNVRALEGEGFTEVQVKTGKVSFKNKLNEEELFLEAHDKGVYQHQSQTMLKEEDESLNAIAWKSKALRFKNTPLQKVLKDLERYYQVNVELSNPALYNCGFTSPFTNSDLDVVLETIGTVYGMKLEKVNDRNYRLVGGACK